MENCFSDVSVELEKFSNESQSFKQGVVDRWVEHEFNHMKPKKCTCEFSAPEFLNDALALIKPDTFNFGDLRLMKKKPKSKGMTHSKKTGKVLFEWVGINE